MTIEAYRQHTADHYSRIKLLLRSPAHYIAGREEKEPTLAMRMGTAVDEFILEGKVRPYAIKPPHHPDDTKDVWQGNKKWCREWVKSHKDARVSVYSQEEWNKTSAMQQALANSPEFQDILEMCTNRQRPVFGTYRGVEFKILVDLDGYDSNGVRTYGDLKTTNDGSPRKFAKKAFDMDYDLQIVLYGTILAIAEGLGEKPCPFWTVVEESPATPVTVYAVPPEAWESGQRKLDRCVDLLLECRETGIYPAYGSGIQNLQWPKWANFEPTNETE